MIFWMMCPPQLSWWVHQKHHKQMVVSHKKKRWDSGIPTQLSKWLTISEWFIGTVTLLPKPWSLWSFLLSTVVVLIVTLIPQDTEGPLPVLHQLVGPRGWMQSQEGPRHLKGFTAHHEGQEATTAPCKVFHTSSVSVRWMHAEKVCFRSGDIGIIFAFGLHWNYCISQSYQSASDKNTSQATEWEKHTPLKVSGSWHSGKQTNLEVQSMEADVFCSSIQDQTPLF